MGGADGLVARRPPPPHRERHRGNVRGDNRRLDGNTPPVVPAFRSLDDWYAAWSPDGGDDPDGARSRGWQWPAAALGCTDRRGTARSVDHGEPPGLATRRSVVLSPAAGLFRRRGSSSRAGRRSVRRDAARRRLSRWLSSRGNSQVAVPQAHERPQRDWIVEPLSGHLAADRYQMSDKFEYFAVRNSAGSSIRRRSTSTGSTARTPSVPGRRARAGHPGCAPGHAQYTAWCDDRGFVVEDGVVLRPAATSSC